MIENVIYKDGDIEINIGGEEELKNRADISKNKYQKETGEFKLEEFKGHREGLGGMKHGEEEKNLKTDLKRTGWKIARKATDVKHVCPVCGTRYWGRPNKAYCGTPCKEVAKKRRQRKRKRDIRDFKPYRGHAGEVYFMSFVKGKEIITFVPAFHADSRVRAKKYLEDTFAPEMSEDYYEQVKEVIRK